MRSEATERLLISRAHGVSRANYVHLHIKKHTKQKKRLLAYTAQFPELCQQTDDDEQGGLRFEIDKSRISIRLTAPYSEERRNVASKPAMETNIFIN